MAYVVTILALALSIIGGYLWTSNHHHKLGYDERDGTCTAEKLAIDNQRLEAERQANALREKGRMNADRAAEEIAAMRAAVAANNERTARELRARASATRQCFSGSVAGLLNAATPIRESVSRDPAGAPAARTAPPAAAPAASADGPGTSELAAAEALRLARTSFAGCREQLRAVLIATDNVPIE